MPSLSRPIQQLREGQITIKSKFFTLFAAAISPTVPTTKPIAGRSVTARQSRIRDNTKGRVTKPKKHTKATRRVLPAASQNALAMVHNGATLAQPKHGSTSQMPQASLEHRSNAQPSEPALALALSAPAVGLSPIPSSDDDGDGDDDDDDYRLAVVQGQVHPPSETHGDELPGYGPVKAILFSGPSAMADSLANYPSSPSSWPLPMVLSFLMIILEGPNGVGLFPALCEDQSELTLIPHMFANALGYHLGKENEPGNIYPAQRHHPPAQCSLGLVSPQLFIRDLRFVPGRTSTASAITVDSFLMPLPDHNGSPEDQMAVDRAWNPGYCIIGRNTIRRIAHFKYTAVTVPDAAMRPLWDVLSERPALPSPELYMPLSN